MDLGNAFVSCVSNTRTDSYLISGGRAAPLIVVLTVVKSGYIESGANMSLRDYSDTRWRALQILLVQRNVHRDFADAAFQSTKNRRLSMVLIKDKHMLSWLSKASLLHQVHQNKLQPKKHQVFSLTYLEVTHKLKKSNKPQDCFYLSAAIVTTDYLIHYSNAASEKIETGEWYENCLGCQDDRHVLRSKDLFHNFPRSYRDLHFASMVTGFIQSRIFTVLHMIRMSERNFVIFFQNFNVFAVYRFKPPEQMKYSRALQKWQRTRNSLAHNLLKIKYGTNRDKWKRTGIRKGCFQNI